MLFKYLFSLKIVYSLHFYCIVDERWKEGINEKGKRRRKGREEKRERTRGRD